MIDINNLTKEEFKTLLMLYASNIDGNIHRDEVDVMLEKANPLVFGSVKKVFAKMGDVEILDCIKANKSKYASTDEECKVLLDDIKAVIQADDRNLVMENHLMRIINKLFE